MYSGQQTNISINTEVVIKIARSSAEAIALKHKYWILQHLSGIHGIPKALWLGQESEYHVIVLKCLGPSLEDHFKACGQMFSLNTVMLIAVQLVSQIIKHTNAKILTDKSNLADLTFTKYPFIPLYSP